MATYEKSSLYGATPQSNGVLQTLGHRRIPRSLDDIEYEIQPQYNYRPDLLANDLYNNASLWWVFKERNPKEIVDPVFDFVAGVKIQLPPLSTINRIIGQG